jgi:hypothetical protein
MLLYFVEQSMKAPGICGANFCRKIIETTMLRLFMEQCRLCPRKLLSNADFALQNHGNIVKQKYIYILFL